MNISITAEDFESVALPHLNVLYRAARRIIGNQIEAEDAVRETYYQAWKAFHRFEAGTNCRAWLFKILFHVIDHQRRKVWRWSLFAEVEDAPCATPTYEPPVAQNLTDEEVLRAFEKMPRHYREVVLLAVSKCPNPTTFQKTLGLNDFYFGSKEWDFPMGHISFAGKLDGVALSAGAPAIAPGFTLDLMAKHSLDFWLTSEDLPDPNNREIEQRLRRAAANHGAARRRGAGHRISRIPRATRRPSGAE